MYDLIRNLDLSHKFIKPYEFAKMVCRRVLIKVDGYSDFILKSS
jgi:hypothetical protein